VNLSRDLQRDSSFLALCVVYGTFYLVRVNVAVVGVDLRSVFGMSEGEFGAVLSLFMAVYGVGQLINGRVGDVISGSTMLGTGLIGSGLISAAIPWLPGSALGFTAVWAVTGYFQSMGWGPAVRLARRLGAMGSTKAGGLAGSYIFGAAVANMLAGHFARAFDWRWGLWLPGAVCVVVGMVVLAFGMLGRRCDLGGNGSAVPEGSEGGSWGAEDGIASDADDCTDGWSASRDVRCWWLGCGLAMLNIVRYGTLLWLPAFWISTRGGDVRAAGGVSALLPLAGFLGVLGCGRLMRSGSTSVARAVTTSGLLVLALVLLAVNAVASMGNGVVILCLLASGFLLYGGHVMFVAILPMVFGGSRRVSSYAGFVDGIGYVGSLAAGWVIGELVASRGWESVFGLLSGASVLSAACLFIGMGRSSVGSLAPPPPVVGGQ